MPYAHAHIHCNKLMLYSLKFSVFSGPRECGVWAPAVRHHHRWGGSPSTAYHVPHPPAEYLWRHDAPAAWIVSTGMYLAPYGTSLIMSSFIGIGMYVPQSIYCHIWVKSISLRYDLSCWKWLKTHSFLHSFSKWRCAAGAWSSSTRTTCFCTRATCSAISARSSASRTRRGRRTAATAAWTAATSCPRPAPWRSWRIWPSRPISRPPAGRQW